MDIGKESKLRTHQNDARNDVSALRLRSKLISRFFHLLRGNVPSATKYHDEERINRATRSEVPHRPPLRRVITGKRGTVNFPERYLSTAHRKATVNGTDAKTPPSIASPC